MDKADFIRLAPAYYELAVIEVLRRKAKYVSEAGMRQFYTYQSMPDEDPSEYECSIDFGPLLDLAIKNLKKMGVVEVLDDPFGPPSYRGGLGLDEYLNELEKDPKTPAYKSKVSDDADAWLRQALDQVNSAYKTLGIVSTDLENPDADWAPIPIDRNDPALLKAEKSLIDTINEVEKSNGYASQHPEERNYVLERLKLLAERLKNAKEISTAYVKANGLDTLKTLVKRFVDSIIGKLANVTIENLIAWLMLRL